MGDIIKVVVSGTAVVALGLFAVLAIATGVGFNQIIEGMGNILVLIGTIVIIIVIILAVISILQR